MVGWLVSSTRLLSFLAVFVSCGFEGHFTFFNDGVFEALGTWETDHGLDTFTDDENVGRSGGEFVASAILQVDDIKRTGVLFFGSDDTNTTLVSTASGHSAVTNFEFDDASDLARLDVQFDGILRLDKRVRVTHGAAVMGDNVRDGTSLSVEERVAANGGFGPFAELFNAAQLKFAFFGGLEAVEDKSTFVVVQEAEFLIGFLDTDDVHETSWEVHVSADFTVNFNQTSHNDSLSLFAGKSVLEAVFQDQAHR